MPTSFDDPALLSRLEAAALESFDDLDFGLIAMDRSGTVLFYNSYESNLSGLSPDRVVGQNFFEAVGPCTNNYLVANRFVEESDLDDTIEYVFTFRMAPTSVRLRLLAKATSARQYLAVVRR